MARSPFVDISEHQGIVDFDTMRGGGVELLIARAGINGRYDLKLDRNISGARAAGIDVIGLYWFINPKSSFRPEAQGDLAASACRTYGVPMLMLDCEWYDGEGGPNPKLDGLDYMRWCERFAQRILDAGVRPTVYTGASFWNPLFVGVGSWLSDLDLVVASYPGWRRFPDGHIEDHTVDGASPAEWEGRAFAKDSDGPTTPAGFDHWDAWQFSAGGNRQGPIYGCQSTDLDLNIADNAVVLRWLGVGSGGPGGSVPLPGPTTPQPPEAADMATPQLLQINDGPHIGAVFLADGWRQTVRWIHDPVGGNNAGVLDVVKAEMAAQGWATTLRQIPGGYLAAFGEPLSGPPGSPWDTTATAGGSGAWGESERQFIINAVADLLADMSVVPNGPPSTSHFQRA